MRTPFSKTLLFIELEEQSGAGSVLFATTLLLLGWLTWLVLAKTTVYAVSEDGRLLAAGAASPIQTPVAGIVAETRLSLGAEVKAGTVLLELDSSAEKLRREEEETRAKGLLLAAESLEQVIVAEQGLAGATSQAAASRVTSAALRAKAAADVEVLSKQQDEAMRRLREASLASGLEALKAAEEMQRQRGQVRVSSAETALAVADLERTRRETAVRLLNLQRELVDLKSRAAASRVVIAQLDWEIARRKLRAPVDGVVADIVALPSGAAVGAGQTVATVVPHTTMKWVAHFPARDAVGRLRPGQAARIRLDAFPWTAYGPLSATVVSVGSEPREQRVRVELDIRGQNPNVVLSHGMTGATDVQVEELSPMRLLLRLSGHAVQGGGATPSPSASSATP